MESEQDSQKDKTIKDQKEVEQSLMEIFQDIYEQEAQPYLYRDEHQYYLYQSLLNLQYNIRYYDTGHPWVVYWIIHALSLLEDDRLENKQLQDKIVKFLSYCQHKDGGFCGGHGQLPQVASTYAAISALMIIGTKEAYDLIDRQGMYNFLMRCKNPDGSFRMAERGEIDMRGSYIAIILSSLLNIKTPELLENSAEYIAKCQTYEGGIGPVPHSEAHGGLTYCGVAALVELGELHKINIQRLIYWSVNRQMNLEGGFQGRTHKLVDNCYSFWQGAVANLLSVGTKGVVSFNNELISNQRKLQMYCLICQNDDGGLFDKPGKHPDLYHTCYALSGLSLSQKRPSTYNKLNNGNEEINAVQEDVKDMKIQEKNEENSEQQNKEKSDEDLILIWNTDENKLGDTDPVYNVNPQKLNQAREYFSKLENITCVKSNQKQ